MAQVNYNSLNKKQLQDEIKKHGGKVTGTVDVLRMRAKRFRDKCPCPSDFPYGKIPDGYLPHQLQPVNNNEVNHNDVNDTEDFNHDCCICMEKITSGIKTKCKHGFHRNCLGKWLQNDSRCPLCRTEIGPIKKKQPVPQTYVEAITENYTQNITHNSLIPHSQQTLIQYASRPQLQRSDTSSRTLLLETRLRSALDLQTIIMHNMNHAINRGRQNHVLSYSIQLADITRTIRNLSNQLL